MRKILLRIILEFEGTCLRFSTNFFPYIIQLCFSRQRTVRRIARYNYDLVHLVGMNCQETTTEKSKNTDDNYGVLSVRLRSLLKCANWSWLESPIVDVSGKAQMLELRKFEFRFYFEFRASNLEFSPNLLTSLYVIIQRINPRLRLDKSFAQTFIFRQRVIVFHLLHGFALFHPIGNDRACVF